MKIVNYVLFPVILLLAACQSPQNRFHVDVSEIEVKDVEIKRYGQAIFELPKDDFKEQLEKLQPHFELFLNADLDDSLNVNQIYEFVNDTFLISIYNEARSTYPNLENLEEDFTDMFKYYKYYFPDQMLPEVYTYISGLDYTNPVQSYNNSIIVSLDMYLGEDFPVYQKLGVPAYILKKFSPENIIPDVVKKLAQKEINFQLIGNNLIDKIIFEGKILYFLDALLPDVHDSLKINYTKEQMNWAVDNEGMIWAFLIENEMFYSSDLQYYQKLILETPFTSYFGVESAPRLGSWVGWQIVRSYMAKNSQVELNDLMSDYDSQKFLNKSGYKPKI